MWWYKIPVLLVVAITNHISLSDQKVTKLRSRSVFIACLVFAFRAFFWALTVCEVALIWSTNHLRSPIAHRILVVLVHPWANFPPKHRISQLFTVGWSISLLSLTIYLTCKSYYQRIRQSSAPPDDANYDSQKWIPIVRRAVHGSSPVMAFGSAACYIVPGSFAYECWVWQLRFWGTIFCFMEVSFVTFWLVMVIWRCLRSCRSGRTVSEVMDGVSAFSDTIPEERIELLAMERGD